MTNGTVESEKPSPNILHYENGGSVLRKDETPNLYFTNIKVGKYKQESTQLSCYTYDYYY